MKKVIIGISVIIVIIIVLLSFIFIQKKAANQDVAQGEEQVSIKQMEAVKDADRYYTVKGCVDTYISYIVEKDSENIYKLLDKDYIEAFGITQSNVMDFVEKLEGLQIVKIEKMYEQSMENNIKIYYAEGQIREDIMEEKTEDTPFYITMKLDENNKTFSIMPFGYMSAKSIQKEVDFNGGKVLVDKYNLYYNKCDIYLTITNTQNQKMSVEEIFVSYLGEEETKKQVSNIQIEAGKTETLKLVFENNKMEPKALQFSVGNNTHTIDLKEESK